MKDFKKQFRYRFSKVTYFTLLTFVLEIVFFHVFNYIYDYFDATLIISYAILGFGLGAYLSSKINISEKYLFIISSLGVTFFLYVAIIKVIFFASVGLSNIILLFVFLFFAIYLAKAYSECKSSQIYLFDMIGCFFGVILTPLLYKFITSETILLLILIVLPLVALINVFYQKLRCKKLLVSILLFFLTLGIFLFYNQITFDKYNLFNLIDCRKSNLDFRKSFCQFPNKLVKSYDNLVGRIDITKIERRSHKVSYDGYINDHLDKISFSSGNNKWPTDDIRILYGAVKDPKVLVIGSSAQGIIKPLKQITSPDLIDAVEINPAILKIMKTDFYSESGKAYEGLNPKLGNGLSFLKSTKKNYDMITLINIHAYRNLAYDGPPDYLHTAESYDLFLNRLTDDGYILFEEYIEAPRGRLALYRMVKTILYTLEKRHLSNPLDHIAIWSWNWTPQSDQYWHGYYVSMIATKNPIKGKLRTKIIDWIKMQESLEKKRIHFEYLNDYYESEEFTQLFKMIRSKDFNSLEKENFDSSVVTNDRPFLSQATLSNKRLDRLMLNIGMLTLGLWIIFTLPLIKSEKRKKSMVFNLYYVLIGFAYFFIEIILLQVYQNIFLSPSVSFIFILGFLFLFSGVGGYFSNKFNLKHIILYLIPVALITPSIPNLFFRLGVSPSLIKALGLICISLSGFLIGVYFPKGLDCAKKLGLKNMTYYFFAINAIAGCCGTVSALYLGIKIGYIYTTIIALGFYLFASFILEAFGNENVRLRIK